MNAATFGLQGLGYATLAHYLLSRLVLTNACAKGKHVYSRIKDGTLVIDRRDVIRGGFAAAALAVAVPGLAHGKGDVPTGETEIIDLMDASAIDVSALQPGEMVVVWMNSTFVGILHRTAEQQAAAAAEAGALSGESDADRVVDPAYLVAELKCLHRGCYVGYIDTPEAAFKCPCHRTTFDTSGRVIKGKTDKSLPFVPHSVSKGVVTFL